MDKSRFLNRLKPIQWHGLLYVPRQIRTRARLEGRAREDAAKARGCVNRYEGTNHDKHQLGRYGELVVTWFFTGCGYKCEEPPLLDTGGHDVIIAGARVEVKTACTRPDESQYIYTGREYLERGFDRFAFVACKGFNVHIYTASPAIIETWPPMPDWICPHNRSVGMLRTELHTQALEMR